MPFSTENMLQECKGFNYAEYKRICILFFHKLKNIIKFVGAIQKSIKY
jgi:hypothetical protein